MSTAGLTLFPHSSVVPRNHGQLTWLSIDDTEDVQREAVRDLLAPLTYLVRRNPEPDPESVRGLLIDEIHDLSFCDFDYSEDMGSYISYLWSLSPEQFLRTYRSVVAIHTAWEETR